MCGLIFMVRLQGKFEIDNSVLWCSYSPVYLIRVVSPGFSLMLFPMSVFQDDMSDEDDFM